MEAARAHYRNKIIPRAALGIMDAEIARLAASNLTGSALKEGDSAPDFLLPDAHGEPVRLYSLLRDGQHVVVAFLSGRLVSLLQSPFAGFPAAPCRIA